MMRSSSRNLASHWALWTFLGLILAGGVIAWVERREAIAPTSQPPDQQLRSRARFMSSLGIALCLLFLLAIIALWIPNHLLNPCPA